MLYIHVPVGLILAEVLTLSLQVQAYMDNRIEVAQLQDDSEQKAAAVERATELEEELSTTVERLQEVENEGVCKIAELQRQLQEKMRELEQLQVRDHFVLHCRDI